MFKRLGAAALGVKPLDRAVTRALEAVRGHASAGRAECTITVQQHDLGVRNKVDAVHPMIAEALQAEGHNVLGVDGLGTRSGVVSIRVRPAATDNSAPITAQLSAPRTASEGLHARLTADQSARTHPEGRAGAPMSAAQLTQESQQLRQWLDVGEYDRAWGRRMELGYGLTRDGVSQAAWFWLQAAPTLAHLRAGHASHMQVRMFAGMAEHAYDTSIPEQCDAVQEIGRLIGPDL